MSNYEIIKNYFELEKESQIFKSKIKHDHDAWKRSPFREMLYLASISKSNYGKIFISKILKKHGQDVSRGESKPRNIMINGKHECVIKVSLLWNTGMYRFQQIKNYNYRFLLCLGISPTKIHFWYGDIQDIWHKIGTQHSEGTRLIDIGPNETRDYFKAGNGDLDAGIKSLLQEIK